MRPVLDAPRKGHPGCCLLSLARHCLHTVPHRRAVAAARNSPARCPNNLEQKSPRDGRRHVAHRPKASGAASCCGARALRQLRGPDAAGAAPALLCDSVPWRLAGAAGCSRGDWRGPRKAKKAEVRPAVPTTRVWRARVAPNLMLLLCGH